jgi:hypothetical protein
MRAYDPETEELEHLAGDAPAVIGKVDEAMRSGRGIGTETDLSKTAIAHPMVRYKDMVLEVDLYLEPGAPDLSSQYLHFIVLCPRCRNALTVRGDRKEIEFRPPTAELPRGVLSCSPFKCTWELESDGRRMEFGLGMCNWTVGIHKNVAKDA